VLNAVGAAFGVVAMLALSRSESRRPLLLAGPRAVLTALAVSGAFVLFPPHLSPFFDVTPGGRQFHKLAASEAAAALALVWWGVSALLRADPSRDDTAGDRMGQSP
jgi:hypothetical protein